MTKLAELIQWLPENYGDCDLVIDGQESLQDAFTRLVFEGAEQIGVLLDGQSKPFLVGRQQLMETMLAEVENLQTVLHHLQEHLVFQSQTQENLIRFGYIPSTVGSDSLAEQAMQLISDGLILLGSSGRVDSANPAACTMLDIPHPAEISQVEAVLNRLGFGDMIERSTRKSSPDSGQFLIKSRKSRLIHVQWALAKDDAGSLLGRVVILKDVTAQTAAENSKTEFLNAISHELRTPLTVLQNAISNILAGVKGKISSPVRSYMRQMDIECRRYADLINNLLDIAKLEAGQMPHSPCVMQLESLVENTLKELESQAESAGIRLTYQFDEELCPVYADSKRIRQVVFNVVQNALRFTPAGGTVEVFVYDRGQDIVVEVADTGQGISAEIQKQLFNKFYQANRLNNPNPQGNGLGLAICKGIVAMHGGSIWVESESGKGSRFFFSLPKGNAADILSQYLKTAISGARQNNRYLGSLIVRFEMRNKSEVPLRQAAGKIIRSILTQVRFWLNMQTDLAMQLSDTEMVVMVQAGSHKTIEHVQNKIEVFLVNLLKKQFTDVPIVPMLGRCVWPGDIADEGQLIDAAKENIGPVLAG